MYLSAQSNCTHNKKKHGNSSNSCIHTIEHYSAIKKKEQIDDKWNNTNGHKSLMLSDKTKHKNLHTMRFHLYEIPKRRQNSSYRH